MKPNLPLDLDHTCWRVDKASYERLSPFLASADNLLCNGPADLRKEMTCPACQWLAGYKAASKGDL